MLGIADVDLFIPILTFVFGEAQLDNRAALTSAHRLRQDFYGLPEDERLFLSDVKKNHFTSWAMILAWCIVANGNVSCTLPTR